MQSSATFNNAIFLHSSGDGYDQESLRETILAKNNALFKHGNGDGWATVSLTEIPPIINNNIFEHTGGDGFDEEKYNQASSLASTTRSLNTRPLTDFMPPPLTRLHR